MPFADELANRTTALAHRHNASPFMVLLACHQLLLHRYTGRDDIAVGSPIANRNWLASEKLISTFVNTLVMRTDLSGDPSFDELLDRVKAVALDAYAHQDLPFDRLVSELRPPRDPSRSPFFQTFFNMQNAPMTLPELDGLTVEAVRFDSRSAQFDVSLTVDSVWSKTLSLEYNTDLFDADHMERMLGHYLTLLDAALTNPEQPISESGDAHRRTSSPRSTVAEHAADADYDRHACVHDLVADQAHRNPNATAVTFGDQSLTYAELDGRANQLAHHLIDLGVEPGDLVGLHLERSAEMVDRTARHPQSGRGVPSARSRFPRRAPRVHADRLAAPRWSSRPPTSCRPRHRRTPHTVTVDASARTIAEHPSPGRTRR